ncbi:glycosyltransferase family 2 protein [Orenia marismortui]|uniref:Dolichol-phosphate mannosyltransferase n=1 Tax=Orenia marismortui TaxID=46469 RepID=A0A4R8HRN0_9FIRM|nr:glycosyltransferase family 2 protein [Orenia marismortui]TDX59257.1 dolichol-phosphate mannosyltransferase [Orenia marismortui]
MSKEISVVVPIYYEEDNIFPLHKRLKGILKEEMGLDYEIIFVNDGSTDNSVFNITKVMQQDSNVKLIDFSRNFGHQIAVTAGIDHSSGKTVVLIDADLQDPPELIKEMYQRYKQGYDVVYAKRKKRNGESLFKKITANLFYRTLDNITDVDIPLDTGDFRLMSRRIVDNLKQMPENNKFIRGLVAWAGFKQTAIEYERNERYSGETGYSLWKMIKFSLDGITSFSTIPLKLASIIGAITSGFSFIYILYIIYLKLFTDITISGWSSAMVSNLFIGGIILLTLGVMGEYVGRIFTESKRRPLYIIKDKRGFKDGEEEIHKIYDKSDVGHRNNSVHGI